MYRIPRLSNFEQTRSAQESQAYRALPFFIFERRVMPAASISSKTVPPISPSCPTCTKPMRLISMTPFCDGVVYGYVCSNDGDHVSWRPRFTGTQRDQNHIARVARD